ncbi:MAG: SDR family oxidoreductase [Verrucomicrobia bacterium]|nr:SDR family oxidoreductase [Verrucomicrobiota bacterium]MCH8526809.1 SDR family oxidoreductase [Kiritimatiellia bacterium]
MSDTVLIFGATSAMALHTARNFAAQHANLALAGRDRQRLEALAEDLKIRGAQQVEIFPGFDAEDETTILKTVEAAWKSLETIRHVLIAYGTLPDQSKAESDAAVLRSAVEVNYFSVAGLCHAVADRMLEQGSGTLSVISSVAGLRGRQSNYVYGSAKGGLNLFLQGLRNRLHPKGIRVLTLLPGFVDTPMTRDVPKGPLFISAEKAGSLIHKAMTRKKADVVYVPGFWRVIMTVIRSIPEPVFKKLKL